MTNLTNNELLLLVDIVKQQTKEKIPFFIAYEIGYHFNINVDEEDIINMNKWKEVLNINKNNKLKRLLKKEYPNVWYEIVTKRK